MALATYANLQTAITNTLDRSDLSSVVADFIRMGEAALQRDLTHWRMEKRATATLDGRFLALPSDFLSPIRLQVSETEPPLRLVTADEMHRERDRAGDSTGAPTLYSVVGGEIEVFRTPGQSYTATLYYRRTIPPLSDSNTSNWLLALAPDLYLYAALLHSAPYLVEDERIPMWGQLYQQGVNRLNIEGERGRWGGQLRRTINR